jgi:hypothetical protein
MAEEPDNHTLRLLREMREETNRRFDEMREETNRRFDGMREDTNRRFDEMRDEAAAFRKEVSVSVAAMRADQHRTNEILETIAETQQNHGTRLNAIEGRLALIEKHTGLVKA